MNVNKLFVITDGKVVLEDADLWEEAVVAFTSGVMENRVAVKSPPLNGDEEADCGTILGQEN